ncbi:MAG: peptide deformylase [Candidatus Vogelbacteria bacterium]|nr:peptide deformylase [Candidatus Vogelbacteria bacterium]
MPKQIRQKTDPILRQKAKAVTVLLPNAKIDRIVSEMRAALDAAEDGVALAAPQIGVSLRLFIVSPKALGWRTDEPGLVFINPCLVKRSHRKVELVEGCLSIRQVYGRIKRSEKVTIQALDAAGRRFTRHTAGLLAQIVQHEIDHLDGILFIDQAHDLTKVK